MTVFEYIQAYPNTTCGDIARWLHKKTPVVAGAISQLYTTGRVVKSGMRNGIPTYRVNDLPYGCGNALLIQFNQLLMECRREAV
ncbi:TPA: hypothetical protein ACNVTV_005729 [Citrobacter freundii]|uniref:hypothetical protein n=1 Tax=Citrobacter freundii TaxID=546 RepID=UPI001967EA22|nr:hypothetical protein [Citrobacter freundii]QSB88042.1 hypothetical protein JW296_11435 [Citrobacter freundii]CAE6216836.1 hypothetical protein AI2642V1_1498 [Citrobacter freundii]CAH3421123.1 hypothetical protein AI2642V1_1498 [Citrobacter freundii]HAU4311523.1 hypothetical protein [Citrobacter freundii]HCR3442023.1 hypothetical protein [Citrobacter freundii]